ncbi:MBL fold metallo-hydrolase [Trichloromonas sp.]|uniref:MBL fold metallo-hydrolase n=1 Tax=Trichloromonas sp. TaxID=3069249 RepID=UPI003D819616
MRQSSVPLFFLLMLLAALPAHAKITFGVVTNANSLLHSEKEAGYLTNYLASQLSEEVSVQIFSSEKTLHDWLNRYRLVDLAILSDSYLASQPPGEFFPLADHVLRQSPQTTSPDLIVARQGLNPWLLQKLQTILLTMGDSPTGREILNGLDVLAIVPPGLRPDELAGLQPPPAPPAPEPLPPAEPIAPVKVPEPQMPVAAAPPAPSEAAPTIVETAPPAKPAEAKPEPVRVEPPRPVAIPLPVSKPPAVAAERELPRRGEALMEIPSRDGKTERAAAGAQASYSLEQVADGVFAAISRPGSSATSNAFFVVGPEYVVAGGAHMTKKAVDDLVTAIRTVTDKPLRHFILAHHHTGYSHIDFDFPAGVDLIISWQTWKAMDDEIRETNRPILFFSDGLTLKLGERTIILTNMGRAHTEGDTLVFFPESGVLFTSDLVYVKSVGYMGDGHMEDWLLALEFIERLGARKIIPGFGPVSSTDEIIRFKDFFRDMVTEVLKHLERGDSLDKTLQTFSLPGYGNYSGYEQFIRLNIRRAYIDLKENFMK